MSEDSRIETARESRSKIEDQEVEVDGQRFTWSHDPTADPERSWFWVKMKGYMPLRAISNPG